jgi:hypothetical protein
MNDDSKITTCAINEQDVIVLMKQYGPDFCFNSLNITKENICADFFNTHKNCEVQVPDYILIYILLLVMLISVRVIIIRLYSKLTTKKILISKK